MLASVNISASNSATLVYTAPATGGKTRSAFSVALTNRSSSAITLRIALTPAATPAADGSNYIEYDVTVPANTCVERTGLMLLATQTLYVQCNTANALSVVVYGVEE